MNNELDNLGRVIETDILILGSGAAGCGAAIGATEKGAREFYRPLVPDGPTQKVPIIWKNMIRC